MDVIELQAAEEEMMKKLLLIVLPIVAIAFFATLGYSKPQPEHRAMDAVVAPTGSGYRLGVVLSEMSPHSRDDLNVDSGVVIERVLADSAADKAGLQDGDVIVKIDGKAVESASEVRRAMREMNAPRPVPVDILRDGKPMNITVTPEKSEFPMVKLAMGNYLGIDLQELDSDLAGYFQTKPGAGVLITRVEPDSPAQKAGLKSGDIVTEFNGSKITAPDELRDAVADTKAGDSVAITVLRHGKEQKLSVTPEETQYRSMMNEMVIPKIEELRHFSESPEFRESMQDLREEMQKMKSELRLRDEDMQKLKQEIQSEMQKLREDLKQYRKSD